MTDQQAINLYSSQRDAYAFRHLVQQYQGLVYSAARRRLNNAHDIDDVVQTTFLKLAKAGSSITQDVASWLYATALNNANELIRSDQARRRHEALAPPPSPNSAETLTEMLDREEWQKLSPLIDDAILALPADERSLLIHHFFLGRSQHELEQQVNIPRSTIRSRLNSAIESIRQSLKAAGHLPAAPALIVTLQRLSQSSVPAPLSAQLTKIGLAGTGGITKPAVAAKSVPWLSSKTALAAAVPLVALMVFIGFEVQKSISHSTPLGAKTTGSPAFAIGPSAKPAPFFSTPDAYGFRTEDAYPTDRSSTPQIIFDKEGTLYIADGDAASHGFVRAKRAGQDRWNSVFEAPIWLNSLAVAPNGDLFVGAFNLPPGAPWPIFRQPAGKEGFQNAVLDPFRMTKNALAVAQDGSIYSAGGTGKVDIRWVVRKQLSGQGGFFTVDDFLLDPAVPDLVPEARAAAYAMTIVSGMGPSAGIYVVGQSSQGDIKKHHWIVRRSTDDGRSWITVDDFASATEPAFSYGAFAVCADPAGNVYVAGVANGYWIIRRSATGKTGTWSTIDQFAPSQGGAICYSITTDAAGNLYAAGGTSGSGGTHGQAVIRTNADGSCHTIEVYSEPMGDAAFHSIVIDQSGHIYVAGDLSIGESLYRIVRSGPLPATLKKNPIAQAPNTH